jgi:hypothetical protein
VVHALYVDGLTAQQREDFEDRLEMAAQEYQIAENRRRAIEQPAAPPPWWTGDQDAAAEALATHRRLRLLQGGEGRDDGE